MPLAPNSRWFILGAGAVGCLFASALQRAGIEVTLLLRNAEALQQWQLAGGIRVETAAGLQLTALPALTADLMAKQKTRIQQLLVCTKSHQSLAAFTSILPFLATNATIVLLQNGMGVRELLQPLAPDATFIHALTTEGVWRRDRFHLVHASRGETVLGYLPSPNSLQNIRTNTPDPADIAEQWQHSTLAIKPVSDIEIRLWHKLAVNCVINPLTALLRCRNGELLQQADIAEQVAQLCAEITAVAHHQAIPLDFKALQDTVLSVIQSTANNRSSMLQDIEQQRPTEIDFLNGYVVRLAQQLGLSATVNARLYQAILRISSEPGPG